MKRIESLDNKIIKLVISLKSGRARKKTKLFLVDGLRESKAALKARFKPKFVFIYSEEFLKKEEILLQNFKKAGAEVIILNDSTFNKISYKEKPDDLISVFEIEEKNIGDLELSKSTEEILVLLEGVEKPGNLGAIIRTAYAAGLKNIILNDCLIDQFNPNVIRASEGLVFFVKVIKETKENTLRFFKENKIRTIGASTKAKKNYSEVSFKEKTAIVLGSEAFGLSDFWLKNIDESVRIPMKKGVDSLNVSVSAAILIYEAVKGNDFISLE